MKSVLAPPPCTDTTNEHAWRRRIGVLDCSPATHATPTASLPGLPCAPIGARAMFDGIIYMTKKRLALIAILLVGVAYGTMIQSFSWNQASHYDLIRSMNQGQTTIDAYQQNTGDKVLYKGHYYSARAPGLALFALPFYDALNLVNAESLTRAHVAPPNHPGDEMI